MHRNNININIATLSLPLSAINSIVSETRVENWEQKYLNSPIYDSDHD